MNGPAQNRINRGCTAAACAEACRRVSRAPGAKVSTRSSECERGVRSCRFPLHRRRTRQPVCIPWVRLFAERVAVATTRGLSCDVDEMLVPLLDLGFEYGATRVRAGDGGTRVFRADGGSVEAIERDGAAESDARRVLERLGAVEIACMERSRRLPVATLTTSFVPMRTSTRSALHRTCASQWRSLGCGVEIDPTYRSGSSRRSPPVCAREPSSLDRNFPAVRAGTCRSNGPGGTSFA